MKKAWIRRAAPWVFIGMAIIFMATTGFFLFQEQRAVVVPAGDNDAQKQSVEPGVLLAQSQSQSQMHDIDSAEMGYGGASEAKDELLLRGLPDGAGGEPQEYANSTGGYSMGTSLTKLDIPALDERVIRNASLELKVTKGRFDERYDRAVEIAREAGGYVSQSKSNATGTSIASGEVIMRIPSRDFEGVLTSLKKLGKVKALDVSSEDVSEEFVDLNSRLKHWRAQEAVMLELMTKAKTITESITIQNNLSQIQMEVERISGRLNYLENRTGYATIRLYMAEPQVVPVKDALGLKAVLRESLKASVKTLGVFLMLVGYLLPLALIAVAGYGVYRALPGTRERLQHKGDPQSGLV
ncbi:MAG TPA: hypothetical protein DE036_01045 [Actinobacteria bacterium]|nr:hypothetical protein [Actinomycetota bacterium]